MFITFTKDILFLNISYSFMLLTVLYLKKTNRNRMKNLILFSILVFNYTLYSQSDCDCNCNLNRFAANKDFTTGLDFARDANNIDFDKVKGLGIKFVFIKKSTGDGTLRNIKGSSISEINDK